jgi:hypothetical protein
VWFCAIAGCAINVTPIAANAHTQLPIDNFEAVIQ